MISIFKSKAEGSFLVTTVTMVAGLMKRSPATVISGVHRMALAKA